MKPMLDLALPRRWPALFTEPLRPGTRRKAVVRNKVAVKKPVADKPGNGVPHLVKGS